MFLIRTAFVLACIVMLLPTDEAQQAKVAGQAGSAIERAATFCERNANTCAAGAELWATFLKKAEFGARLAGNMAQEWMRGSSQTRATVENQNHRPLDQSPRPQPSPAKAIEPGRGMLGSGDVAPNWRGGIARAGG